MLAHAVGQAVDATVTAGSSHSSTPTSASYMYRDALLKLGPLSSSSWPRRAQLLPKVVAGYAGVAGAEWYLTGAIQREEYTVAGMPQVLGDPVKQKEYEKWVRLADALKMVVATYGGADAEARVETYETRLGNAPGLWNSLEEWYGRTETGAERVVQVAEIFNSRWDETTSPAVWIAELRKKQAVINSAYEADAKKAADQTDRNVIADLNAAISSNLLRDLVLAFLPDSYADTILQSVTRTTTLDELQTWIVNLHATRLSRETIAGIESARRVAPSPSSAPPAPSQPTPHHSWTGNTVPRGGRGKRQRGGPKLAATRYSGYERWRGGTFKDANGTTRFKVPAGSCFACFKEGHMARDCPTADQARSRMDEMKKDGITVPIGEAMALLTLDLNDGGETPDGPVLAAFRAMASRVDQLPLSQRPASATAAGFRILATDVDPELHTFARTVSALPLPLSPSSSSIADLPGLRMFASDPADDPADRVTPSVGLHVFDTPVPAAALRTSVPVAPSDYILDSGATRHFTTRLDHLHDYKPYAVPHPVGGAFGSVGHAHGEGTVVLTFPSGPVAIPNVMYVPTLGVNLLSQTRLMLGGMRFSNDRERLVATDEEGRALTELVVKLTLRFQASSVLPSPIPSSSRYPLARKLDDADLASRWHRRLGHLPWERLKQLGSCSNGLGEIAGQGLLHTCPACKKSKAARKPVAKQAVNPPTRRHELLAADTWGPSPVRGLQGERLAMAIVDGATRYMWTETMGTRATIPGLIIDRLKRLGQLDDKILVFQSDNGTEFVNKTLDDFLTHAGIQHRRTVPYVHGQNGLVERRWRTLLETTRTLLSDSGLPLSFWPYALHSATYLYNRSPTSALAGSTPFEAYHGTIPDLSNLRAWGCVAYLRLTPEGRSAPHKLADRGIRARFIGYPEDSKGWVFWIPEQRKVVVGWNATFVEDDFTNEHSEEEETGMDRWLGQMDSLAEDQVRPPREEEEEEGREDRRADEPEEEMDNSEEQDEGNDGEMGPREGATADAEQGHAEAPAQPAPAPTPPPPRRSHRLAGMDGADSPFYQPLQGAPPRKAPPPTDAIAPDLAFSTFSNSPPNPRPSHTTSTTSLAFATHSVDLEHDPGSTIALAFDADAHSTSAELRGALERALATSPSWNGSLDEPSYRQAMAGPDVEKWTEAMEAELAAFEATGTWEEKLVELPTGRRAIAVKWVLLVKRDADGRVIKYKARLVARGDMQVEGVDFDETFSSTVRLTTVRLVLSLLAAHPHWEHRQFDISNAYLLGTLDNEIYIKQPPGFVDSGHPMAVRRLKKALYGLRQGGREWQKVLRAALEKVGFRRTDADHGLYVRRRDGRVAIVPTHVDDGMMVGDDDLDGILDRLSEELGGKLKRVGTDLFLGMRVQRKADGTVEVDQAHYTRAVLARFFPAGLTPRTTPLDADYGNVTPASEDEHFECQYRELLGALVYLSACTRPDIAFALSFASRFATCPAERHWRLLIRLCRYLKGTSHLGLRYLTPRTPFSADLLTAWSDADHGADKETRRSISGFVFGVGDDSLRSTAISWLSRRQRSVAISSTEAEYMALSEAA
ncbi:hypothetical protein JCM1841_004389 [Sporobolomyces salmonicolor]